MKNNNHNHFEPVERQHYKKAYLKRRIQEQEAEEEMRRIEDDYESKETDYRPTKVS